MPALETCEGESLGRMRLVEVSQSNNRVTLSPFTLSPSRCHFPSLMAAPNSRVLPLLSWSPESW